MYGENWSLKGPSSLVIKTRILKEVIIVSEFLISEIKSERLPLP